MRKILAGNLAPFGPHGVTRVRVLEPCTCSLATARDLIMLAIFWWGHTAERFQGRRLVLPLMAADGACAGCWGLQLTGYRHSRRHASQTDTRDTRGSLDEAGVAAFRIFFFSFLVWSTHQRFAPWRNGEVCRCAVRLRQILWWTTSWPPRAAYYRRPGTWATPNRRSRTLPPERGPLG